jgi:AraC-like DNA-binding protein
MINCIANFTLQQLFLPMQYQVYAPSVELQPFVKCFWTLDDETIEEKPTRQRVLPDGCMEMIFHYGDLYEQFLEDGSSVIQPRCFVFGQIATYIEIAPTGTTGLVAARFLPDGLTPFLEIPVATLFNKAVPIANVFGEKGKELEEKVLAANDNSERLHLIGSFLLSRMVEPHTIHAITKECIDIILQSGGQLDMIELAGKLKINRRSMEGKFEAVIGMSPKQLSRAVRLQATLKMLDQKNFSSLTALAYESGYYDQAHFIKDFKEFTGISPKSFFSENLKFASLFASGE